MKKYLSFLPLAIFIIAVIIFYGPFIFSGKLPIPSDTIVGLYHPFRDLYSDQYPRGIPFKNFLITDPVREILVWKELTIESLSNLTLPLWNPYEMAGKPLMGNMQSSPFYPLNLILFIKPFYISWPVFIMLQTFLAGIFMYLYLKNLKLNNYSAALGSLAFAFSGFSIAWLEWGNIVHTGIWLPLILLSGDKIIEREKSNLRALFNKENIIWSIIFLFSLSSSFLAGHLQTFFYICLITISYLLFKWIYSKRNIWALVNFTTLFIIFIFLTFFQWYQALIFILHSARSVDRSYLSVEGWFMPWQNLIQFFAPDYFGNPATGNYWGVWNYAEFVGYVGIAPLILALLAILLIRRKIIYFFSMLFIFSIILMTKNFIAEIPFMLNIPFVSTAQPTRIIFVSVFALSVLSALGLDYLINKKISIKKGLFVLSVMFSVLVVLWVITFNNLFLVDLVSREISLRNLVLPSLIGLSSLALILSLIFIKGKAVRSFIVLLILVLVAFDLVRFGNKFTPFTEKEYLFPNTKITQFLEERSQEEVFRIAALNDEILPPNFSAYYRVQSVGGYDPLYLLTYAEFIAAVERGEPNISPPFGFNRIINPKNYESELFGLLNVKYILSFDEIDSEDYELVMEEGRTKLYEVIDFIPRVFFVENVIVENSKERHIEEMYLTDLKSNATVFTRDNISGGYAMGEAIINNYSDNFIEIQTENDGEGFLVITDAYYPLWEARIDGDVVDIYQADYTFRGIVVPAGKHKIELRIRVI